MNLPFLFFSLTMLFDGIICSGREAREVREKPEQIEKVEKPESVARTIYNTVFEKRRRGRHSHHDHRVRHTTLAFDHAYHSNHH